jgi:hypothetical protein
MVQGEGCGRADSRDPGDEPALRAKTNRRLSITVLICTLNEEESLPHVLPRIPAWVDEVLLVDGHSTDNTVVVARKLRPDVEVLYQPGRGKMPCGTASTGYWRHHRHPDADSRGRSNSVRGHRRRP